MNYIEVASQEAENLITEVGAIIVRTDLLPPPIIESEPVIAYTLIPETNFASASLSTPDNVNLDFGTGNFEIVFDFKMSVLNNGAHQFFISKGTSINNSWYIMYEGIAGANLGHIFVVGSNNAVAINVDAGITDTTNYHTLMLKRVDGLTALYIDGVVKGTMSNVLIDTTGALYIGAWNYTPTTHRFLGKMQNVIITKG